MNVSAAVGLARMLEERQDLVAALRFAQRLPMDTETSVVPIERPLAVDVVEVTIGCIPVVGTAVALLEATTGRDHFGYQLDEFERTVLAAGALLPIAARFVKAG